MHPGAADPSATSMPAGSGVLAPLTMVCMKWGTRYGAEYVNNLHAMLARHTRTPFQLVCFTDDPQGVTTAVRCLPIPDLPVPPPHHVSPWRKLALLGPELGDLRGWVLFLDLDLLITGPVDAFFAYAQERGTLTIIENWTQMGQGIGNSSVFCFEVGRHADIHAAYLRDPAAACAGYANEQVFLSRHLSREKLAYWPEAWVRSFKRHCIPRWPLDWFTAPRLPDDARIVAFHGHPKPEDAITGHWPGKWYRRLPPTPWVAEHWRGGAAIS